MLLTMAQTLLLMVFQAAEDLLKETEDARGFVLGAIGGKADKEDDKSEDQGNATTQEDEVIIFVSCL